ncbi:hypothetical protein [Rhizobium leguminosarum]|uniref:hypothetical protein n=1 Tax=Rhizobium leguminosarum TaxID=384 RepID=UPI001441D74E|nr:hypothetical protein [Rhizobium leguminosarum]MBY5794931.1 hypothetical protein [Rhizobium leguminosarum]MBY5801157.1 hypothetical protein [Rhizobium leguminosarum]NKK26956.1 hypothetical protein [Rhizobium leguminosarum bv. viciae]NKK68089.1 hypothetical protein [Rhizobium leguminosarum bv. viciae]NKL96357.1 hypothetical protein [Rhizobium leguminosarum bv. viciae]
MWVAGSPDCDAAIGYNIETAEDPGLVAAIANITTVEPRANLPERYSSSLLTLASRQERHPIARAQALILFTTLSFAFSRTNLTAGAIVGVDYLFNRNRTTPPPERDLQKDFFSFIQSTAPRQIAVRERSDRGGGRADIDFVLNGVNVVAELKKTDADHDLEGLARTYGLQTAAYQRSSCTFCVLMVLDLVDRRGAAAHIRERVSVQEVIPPAGKTRYSVVVVRIQGMLRAPNELK